MKKSNIHNIVSAASIVSTANTEEPVPFNQVIYGVGAVDFQL